jgi:hypothetical protein
MNDTIKRILKIVLQLLISILSDYFNDDKTKKISNAKPKIKTIETPK